MKWNYNGTTGLANNDNEFFELKNSKRKIPGVSSSFFFFFENTPKKLITYQSGSLSSSNLKVSIVFHGIQEKKKQNKNFATVC